MKKLICLLAVMFMAAPVLADMYILGEDIDDGRLKLSYYTDAGEKPRGVAIKLSLSDGGTIESGADVVSVNPAFNTNIDYAYEDPCSYNVGDGHALADPDNPGVPDFGSGISVVTVCMGVLDPCGNQAPAGGGGTAEDPCYLITLQLYDPCEAGSIEVTVSADELRSTTGAVGSTIDVTYPGGITITYWTPCYPQDDLDDYAQWQRMGELHSWKWGASEGPPCWCNGRQCHGDADIIDVNGVPLQNWEGGALSGYMYVGSKDKNVLIGAYKEPQPTKGSGIENITVDRGDGKIIDGICADFNHDFEGGALSGYMYVGAKDKNRLLYNYKGNHGMLEPTKGSGLPNDYCYPTYPAEYDL